MALQTTHELADTVLAEMTTKGRWFDIAEQERTGARVAEENRRNSELVAPLPSRPALQQLVDVAFSASMIDEEGRRTAATIAYVSPDGVTRSDRYRFKEPLEFSPRKLAKLAPATDPSRTLIGVWLGDDGRLSIWGLIHFGDKRFAIDLTIPEPCLRIEVLATATLRISFDSRLLGTFVRDHWNSMQIPLICWRPSATKRRWTLLLPRRSVGLHVGCWITGTAEPSW